MRHLHTSFGIPAARPPWKYVIPWRSITFPIASSYPQTPSLTPRLNIPGPASTDIEDVLFMSKSLLVQGAPANARDAQGCDTLHLIVDHIGGFCRARDAVTDCDVVSSVVACAGHFSCCRLRAACRHRQSSSEYSERGWVWVLLDTDRSR